MPTANIIDKVQLAAITPYIMVMYEDSIGVPANSDSTSLIELELPGLSKTMPTYIQQPSRLIDDKSYAINFGSLTISCNSTDFDYRILNRNDITMIDTVYDLLTVENINKNNTYLPVYNFIIRNRDVVLDNKIYLFVENHSGIDTGIIRVELTFLSLQDREF